MILPQRINVTDLLQSTANVRRRRTTMTPHELVCVVVNVEDALLALHTLRPIAEWHEDFGVALWHVLPIEEPPYVGTPQDIGFNEIYTHFSPLPDINALQDHYQAPRNIDSENESVKPQQSTEKDQGDPPMDANETAAEQTPAAEVPAEAEKAAEPTETATDQQS